MDAKTLFDEKLPRSFEKNPERAKTLDAIYLFKITGERGGSWTVNLKGEPKVTPGEATPPECTIEITDEDFEALTSDATGQLGIQLFFQGKIKISGDPVLATKLQTIFSLGK